LRILGVSLRRLWSVFCVSLTLSAGGVRSLPFSLPRSSAPL
jgi:hypothetical protein